MEVNKGTYEGFCAYTRWEFTESNNAGYYKQVIAFLKEKKIKTMVDIGACIGEVTQILTELLPDLKATLLEPVTENVAFMKGRFLGNKNIKVFEKLIYYSEPTREIGVNLTDNIGGNSIFAVINGRSVPTCTLEDSSIQYFAEIPDLIKLDVEGAELDIIQYSTLLKKVPYIEVEFHHFSEDLGDRAEWMKQYLPHKVVFSGPGTRFLLSL